MTYTKEGKNKYLEQKDVSVYQRRTPIRNLVDLRSTRTERTEEYTKNADWKYSFREPFFYLVDLKRTLECQVTFAPPHI